MQLTEGMMMEPEASVSALVFHHPDCAYFTAEESECQPPSYCPDARLGTSRIWLAHPFFSTWTRAGPANSLTSSGYPASKTETLYSPPASRQRRICRRGPTACSAGFGRNSVRE